MSVLRASGVRKRFGDETALEGVDLEVEAGEIVVLMGPNGAGKTVLLTHCAGASEPDAGRIELFGGEKPASARGRLSVSIQNGTVDPDLTGRENLRFYQRLHPSGTSDWKRLAGRFELTDDLDRTVSEYSGGMRRKVELASTLSADVPLYLLDEPAAELDLSMLRVLHDELLALRDDGATVLLTSHTPLDAQIADRLVFLRDGRVVADGSPEALLDALPTVLRVRGGLPPDERLIGERTFRRGDEFRGFLGADVDLAVVEDEVAAVADDPLIQREQPSYTDLFNYYTYVAEETTDRSTGTQEVVADGGQRVPQRGSRTDPGDGKPACGASTAGPRSEGTGRAVESKRLSGTRAKRRSSASPPGDGRPERGDR